MVGRSVDCGRTSDDRYIDERAYHMICLLSAVSVVCGCRTLTVGWSRQIRRLRYRSASSADDSLFYSHLFWILNLSSNCYWDFLPFQSQSLCFPCSEPTNASMERLLGPSKQMQIEISTFYSIRWSHSHCIHWTPDATFNIMSFSYLRIVWMMYFWNKNHLQQDIEIDWGVSLVVFLKIV